jgi:hypothetical protein
MNERKNILGRIYALRDPRNDHKTFGNDARRFFAVLW